MGQFRTVLLAASLLSAAALSGVAAQTPDPVPGRTSPAATGPATLPPGSSSAAELLPAQSTAPPKKNSAAVPGGDKAVGAKPAVTLLATPPPTTTMPKPGVNGAVPSAGATGSGSVLPREDHPALSGDPAGKLPLGALNAPAGNLPVGTDPALPSGPSGGVDLNAPAGTGLSTLPEPPGSLPDDAAPANAPGVGTAPLLSHQPEHAPAAPPTPVPVLPLGIIYGVIVLLAGGYFWYTSRLANTEGGLDR